MNRTFIISLTAAASIAAASVLQFRWQEARLRAEALSAAMASAEREAGDLARNLELGKQELRAERERLAEANRVLAPAPSPEAEPLPFAPETDGLWPESKPWAYLRKSHIPRFGLEMVRMNGTLTEEAALLFGMSPQERLEVEDALGRLHDKLERTEVERAEPSVANHAPDHMKVVAAFKIPALPEEETGFRAELESELQTILGPARASLLLKTCEPYFLRALDNLGSYSRDINYIRDPADHGESWTMISVLNTANRARQTGKYYYPNDETRLAYQKYARLHAALQNR